MTMISERTSTPLQDQLTARQPINRTLNDFLEWMETNNLHLAYSVGEELRQCPMAPRDLITRFLGINPDDLAAEKRVTR